MSHYLILDFETNGIDAGALPCTNYPMQVSAILTDAQGQTVDTYTTLIAGATSVNEWVSNNCTHLSVKKCEREGVEFREVLSTLARMVNSDDTILVAHNLRYDYDMVLKPIAKMLNLERTDEFVALSRLRRFCTSINKANWDNDTCYYYKKLGKRMGPSLQKLAKRLFIKTDGFKSHNSEHDVELTRRCLAGMIERAEVVVNGDYA